MQKVKDEKMGTMPKHFTESKDAAQV